MAANEAADIMASTEARHRKDRRKAGARKAESGDEDRNAEDVDEDEKSKGCATGSVTKCRKRNVSGITTKKSYSSPHTSLSEG